MYDLWASDFTQRGCLGWVGLFLLCIILMDLMTAGDESMMSGEGVHESPVVYFPSS